MSPLVDPKYPITIYRSLDSCYKSISCHTQQLHTACKYVCQYKRSLTFPKSVNTFCNIKVPLIEYQHYLVSVHGRFYRPKIIKKRCYMLQIVRTYKFFIVSLFMLLLSGCGGSAKASTTSWITIEDRDKLSESTWAAAIDAAVNWDAEYDCGREVTISAFETQSQGLGGGYTEVTLEQAGPGYIKLGNEGNAYNIVLHAMTHACSGNLVELTTPEPFDDGIITGFEGMSVRVTLITGETTSFTKIEEAVAERNASCLQPGYSVTDARYFEIGKQARKDWPCGNNQVVTYLKNSDFVGLLSDYFRVDPDQVSFRYLIDLMSIYDQAWRRGSP